jgi:type 1 fimbria pilin
MKTYICLLVSIFILISVSGCDAPKKEVELSGNVKTTGNNISVNGTSTLEKGAKIKIELKQLGTDAVLEENTVAVDEHGNYSLNFSRENRDEDQKLTVSFTLEEQSEEIQKTYGVHGENISESSIGIFNYRINGEKYNGIRMFDFVYKVVKGSTGQRSFLLDQFHDPNEGEE